MDHTQRLLQAVAESGRTGADACEQLIRRTNDAEMRRELTLEKQQYSEGAQDAETRLYNMGVRPEARGPAARAGMWAGMQINTMIDKTPSHIADIAIQGATMGVVELTKARNTFSEASADAQGAASWLITRQQEAIDRLKAFLNTRVVVK